MLVLAIELSTVRASVALCRDEAILAETSWIEPMARHQQLFEAVPELLKQSGLDWPAIDLFAVGRGPGAFSGIRIGLMAAQMYAVPLNKPVVAISSGTALATELLAKHNKPVVICGDARRGMFWYGVFVPDFSGWKLATTENFAGLVPADSVIATPHGTQTTALRAATPALHWLEGDHFPTAYTLARLALAATTSEPLEPIYLHPPV